MELLLLANLTLKKYNKQFSKTKLIHVLTLASLAYLTFVLIFISVTLSHLLEAKSLIYIIPGYFLTDLLVRLFFQRIQADVLTFVFLPIRKSSLAQFVLIQNLFNAYNLIPLLLFIPIFINVSDHVGFLLPVLLLMVLFIHGVVTLIKIVNKAFMKTILIVALLLSFSTIFTWSIRFIDTRPTANGNWILYSGVVLNILLYFILYTFIRKNILRLGYERFGKRIFSLAFTLPDELLMLEIKLITGNKRTLTYLLGSVFLVFCFGYIGDFSSQHLSFLTTLFFSALSIIIPLFYSQYLFSWESEYFGFILSNTSTDHYLSSKLKLLNILFFLNTVCLTPMLVTSSFNSNFLGILIFQIGVVPILFLVLSLNNDQPLSLSKGAFLNYQGTSVNTFILILLGPTIPIILLTPFYLLGFPSLGFYFLGITGLLILILRKNLIKVVEKIFRKKKYAMYSGFKFN